MTTTRVLTDAVARDGLSVSTITETWELDRNMGSFASIWSFGVARERRISLALPYALDDVGEWLWTNVADGPRHLVAIRQRTKTDDIPPQMFCWSIEKRKWLWRTLVLNHRFIETVALDEEEGTITVTAFNRRLRTSCTKVYSLSTGILIVSRETPDRRFTFNGTRGLWNAQFTRPLYVSGRRRRQQLHDSHTGRCWDLDMPADCLIFMWIHDDPRDMHLVMLLRNLVERMWTLTLWNGNKQCGKPRAIPFRDNVETCLPGLLPDGRIFLDGNPHKKLLTLPEPWRPRPDVRACTSIELAAAGGAVDIVRNMWMASGEDVDMDGPAPLPLLVLECFVFQDARIKALALASDEQR